jgi:CheY-like chemotaxis protein
MSLKIMVVDDDPATLRSMRAVVVPLGYNPLTLEDSQEAAELVEKHPFDVIFVGLGMPHPVGSELIRCIQDSQPNRETPIVVLASSEDIQVLRQAFGEGAMFVLPKPIAAGRVVSLLAAMSNAGWKERRRAARLPLFTEVNCKWDDQQYPLRSMNISETGMLLQPSVDVEIGQEVSLEFRIGEVRASLNVRGCIVRKEGTERVAVEFRDLAPEDQNAIQLYVMGRLEGQARSRKMPSMKIPRLKIFPSNE